MGFSYRVDLSNKIQQTAKNDTIFTRLGSNSCYTLFLLLRCSNSFVWFVLYKIIVLNKDNLSSKGKA